MSKLIKTTTEAANLKSGEPVALPTETVYGLAAPIDQPSAINKIFELKKRPLHDPLIVHVSDLEMALTLFDNPHPDIEILGKKFWPGPLSLIYKKNKELVSDLITSNLDKVAVRIPQSEIFREVIKLVGKPLAAPSANLFKKVSPTKSEHVLKTFSGIYVLEGETSKVGIESTIYDIELKKVLRPGDISAKEISDIIAKKVTYSEKLFTPGSEKEHYQPNTPVYTFENKNLLDSFIKKKSGAIHINLPNNPKEIANTLYSLLRDYDGKGAYLCFYFSKDWVTEDWFAVKNRLKKASTKWIKDE